MANLAAKKTSPVRCNMLEYVGALLEPFYVFPIGLWGPGPKKKGDILKKELASLRENMLFDSE